MITIITPVYNAEQYIESCMKNVIDQRYSHSQHIIIDGNSTDSTASIIQAYAERYSHICWISEKDLGQSDAMNKGVLMAQGNIIGVLNVDDYYEPNALKRVGDTFRSLPEPSLLIGNCNIWGDSGSFLDVNRPSHLRMTDLLIGDEAKYPFPVNPSAYFYHKSLHDRIGLYDINEHQAMDIDFLLRAIPHSNVVYINETLGNFRLMKGTKTYKDLEAGRLEARMRDLICAYRKKLPFNQRSRVLLLDMIYRSWRTFQKAYRSI